MRYRWFPRRPASAAGRPGASPERGSPDTRAASSRRARCGTGIAREARPRAAPTRPPTTRPRRRACARCRRQWFAGRAPRSPCAADPTVLVPPARGADRSKDRSPRAHDRLRTGRPVTCRRARAAPPRGPARGRRRRRSCVAARRTRWPRRATRTPGPRCTRASGRPTSRAYTGASGAAAPNRVDSATSPAGPRPARAACRAGVSATRSTAGRGLGVGQSRRREWRASCRLQRSEGVSITRSTSTILHNPSLVVQSSRRPVTSMRR